MSDVAIADTGLLVAYLDPDDQHHAWAVRQFERFSSLLTCEAVLSEACFLARRQHKGAARVMGLLTEGVLEIGLTLVGEELPVAALMAQYASVPMSFADACLVRMSELHPACSVVTTDSDFFTYRRNGREAIPVTSP